jgi:hypothetical protein
MCPGLSAIVRQEDAILGACSDHTRVAPTMLATMLLAEIVYLLPSGAFVRSK